MRIPLLLLIGLAGSLAQADEILGFDAEGSAAQRGREAALDASISADEMDEWLRHMSKRPHHVGSVAGKEVAEFVAGAEALLADISIPGVEMSSGSLGMGLSFAHGIALARDVDAMLVYLRRAIDMGLYGTAGFFTAPFNRYRGNAESYLLIGDAMVEAVLKLLPQK